MSGERVLPKIGTTQEDQRVLDARMEYGYLLTNYMPLANMVWVAYGAFFAINTLLATALGLSYSDAAKIFDKKFLIAVHLLLPITGMFISLVAIVAGRQIVHFQRLASKRGRELEVVLFAKIFVELEPYSNRRPIGTTIGSLLFFAMWASAIYAAIGELSKFGQ